METDGSTDGRKERYGGKEAQNKANSMAKWLSKIKEKQQIMVEKKKSFVLLQVLLFLYFVSIISVWKLNDLFVLATLKECI